MSLSRRAIVLQIAALSALAVAQPLLELLRQNPEFLTVHHARGVDITILLAALLVLVPAVIAAPVLLLGVLGPRVRDRAHAVVAGVLTWLIMLPMVDRAPLPSAWLVVAIAAVPGVLLSIGLRRLDTLRRNLGYLALLVPVFLVLFLSSAQIFRLLFPSEEPVVTVDQVAHAPVFVLILDELPTYSLVTRDGSLDRELLPNFGRLADTSTWFRNATTVSPATLRSVPSILAGRFPGWRDAPTIDVWPQNLFTLLQSSHRISALESQTSLAPEAVREAAVPRLGDRLELLFDDLFIMYQHVVTPGPWRSRLVPVEDKWANFRGAAGTVHRGGRSNHRMDQFVEFMDGIEVTGRPNLAVAHILFPHVPFHHLPDGTKYNKRRKAPVMEGNFWGPDSLVTVHSFRRHLLQVAATDQLIGVLIDRLEELGIYEEAAIVVTADHGVCFQPGLNRREFADESTADVMAVPLFIKRPGQVTGEVDLRNAQTVDILPTLAAAIGYNLDWPLDGVDLLATAGPVRNELDFLDQDTYEHRMVDPAVVAAQLQERTVWKSDLVGDEGDWRRVFSMGDPGGLMGREVRGAVADASLDLRGRILDAQDLEDVDPGSAYIPAEINGTIVGHDGARRLTVALALDGRIAGVTQTYQSEPGSDSCDWQVLVSPDVFQAGSNEARLFLVEATDAGFELVPIPLHTPSFLGVDIGSQTVAGIREEGFFKTISWSGTPARWTGPRASWVVPIKPDEKPEELHLSIVYSGPAGSELSIQANGQTLCRETLPRGPWEVRLPLRDVDLDGRLKIEVVATGFVPAEVNPESGDRRQLGIAVTSLVVR